MKKFITLILFTIIMTAGVYTAQAQTKTTKVLIDTSMGQIEAEHTEIWGGELLLDL